MSTQPNNGKLIDKVIVPKAPPAPEPEVGSVRMTTTPFAIDHEGNARAGFVKALRDEAIRVDKLAAVASIDGDHALKDIQTDRARAFRIAADYLATLLALVLMLCLSSCALFGRSGPPVTMVRTTTYVTPTTEGVGGAPAAVVTETPFESPAYKEASSNLFSRSR